MNQTKNDFIPIIAENIFKQISFYKLKNEINVNKNIVV